MNTYTHKPTQEIYIHVMGGKSFHNIIYIMPAAIPITSVSHTHTHARTHTHTHTHTPTERHTQKNTLANISWDAFRKDEFLASFCQRGSLRGGSNPRRCIMQDSEHNTPPTELFQPTQSFKLMYTCNICIFSNCCASASASQQCNMFWGYREECQATFNPCK